MRKLIAMSAVFAGLAGCATVPSKEWVVDNRADYPAIWLDPANCSVKSPDARARSLLASMAALSDNSYLSMEEERLCRSNAAFRFEKCATDFSPTDRPWKIVGGNGEGSPTGLGYRIYESSGTATDKPLLVFAFRGTAFFSRDWLNNLYPRTSIAPPQQREAEKEIREWISTHRPNWNLETGAGMENEEIYAVGHSLGGALAEYFAYILPRTTAIVFNPSPRTGFGSIAPEKFRNPPVCEMRESYELLFTLIGGLSPVVQPDLQSCGFINQQQLSPRLFASLLSAHGIHAIAEALSCYAKDGTPSLRCAEIVAHKESAMPGKLCRSPTESVEK
jgi:hypothetical protein